MGVPLLLTWLRRRFAACFLPSNSNVSADCLYIDVNGLVYQAATLATSGGGDPADIEAAILRRLFDLLDDIVLRLVRPRSLVYLAVDGISPMGKLAQQRSRRRRRRRQDPHSHVRTTEWDSNSISVGTSFMSSLTDALHFYCASRAERINVERLREYKQRDVGKDVASAGFPANEKAAPSLITFVSDNVWRPGEGESKIADAIRRFRSQPSYDPNTAHVICSSDTDVTVCSLILHEPNIHVLRYEHVSASTAKGGNNNWQTYAGDSWASTFFSIYAFREELRLRLRIEQTRSNTMSAEELEKLNKQFEAALHDVVFVLLLFGNDFLPSVGCRIEEGFLDSLLEMLATDFVTRGRSIVDPVTNTIQFDAARYALESLAEMRNERSSGLQVDNGAEGAADWGFVNEQFLQRKAAEEAEKAPWCYAYWTMLQWSLQNSAGVVEHWGCYYPYSTAPPLHLLQKYCGTLSYDALMELAEKRSRRKVGHHNRAHDGTNSGSGERGVRLRGPGPTDVLVQLLVLLPTRSIALLPTAVRKGYSEIEPIVVAPVEEIDFAAVQTWCATKRGLFTEEERVRFDAYALAASDHLVAGDVHAKCVRGNEMLFVADWNAEELAAELRELEEIVQGGGGTRSDGSSSSKKQTDTLNSATGVFTSFFSARNAGKTSAAVAALLSAPKFSRNIGEGGTGNADTVTTSSGIPNINGTSNNTDRDVLQQSIDVDVLSAANFTFHTVSTSALKGESMVRRVGNITGDTFECGSYSVGPLSRNQKTMRVRLRWRVASRPPRDAAPFLPYLLSGLKPRQKSAEGDGTAGKEGVKRPRSEVAKSAGDDDAKKNVFDDFTQQTMLHDTLQEKKEALRRRLEALQGGNATLGT
ncbi:5'-3' exonuclease XRNC, putative [Trypanosoma brucei brucei TREU927]|uniref:5'-3' exonuclease XRNC, putative n=1 Tax=Trypanosoma brucei brucei (strain 927/4 GUTat10.1) TaxID=185431 RepID=Q57W91_TRYB2|nr:5'-3' exonuclease XRNC, putative [Trypanosoma brucei brucei TREU927]AAX70128.1 5'-3' exonuclease XRNC, putative [Trypanosoma brucei]AAZ13047.1 5'-3' exonuclease XRNC, putative [Trypanosoma brucei brucei TREU927]